jgi:peptide/nickel transport system ATP-binding protein
VSTDETLKISDLSVLYSLPDNLNILALDRITLEIPVGGYTIGIVGESGSGKTTLGMSIMNLIEPPGRFTSGRIEYINKNVLDMNKKDLRKYRWEEVSMVYQSAMNSLNPVKTVCNHISEVLREHRDISKGEAHETSIRLLSNVGITPERADDYPHEFSGGMRQRVIIAMALALSPKLLIADEPTSALDVVVQRQILALLKERVSQNRLSLLFITHEIAILSGLVNNVAVMFAGEICEFGPTSKVLFDPLHPYTQMLVGSMLTFDSDSQVVLDRTESESSRLIPSVGCRYANRCRYVFDRCRIERPVLREVENGRWVACHKYNN